MVDVLGAVQAGQSYADRLYRQGVDRQVGSRLAQNDYQGAANTAFQSGDLQTGQGLLNQQQANQTRQQAETLQEQQRQLAFTMQAVRTLTGVRDQGGNVVEAFDRLAPVFAQMGTDPQQIVQLRQTLEANPQFLDQAAQIIGQQARELEFRNAGQDVLVLDAATGQLVNRYEQAPQDYSLGVTRFDGATNAPVAQGYVAPQYIQQDPTRNLLEVSPGQQPRNVNGGTGGEATPSAVDVTAVVQEILPGARFNSGLRTPEQNRSAGGAERSYHLQGRAVDIQPPAGVNIRDFRRQLEAQGVEIAELLDEGDHWHLAWRGGGQAPNYGRGEAPRSGGPRVVAAATQPAGGRQEGGNVLSAEEIAAIGLPPGTVAQRSSTGQISILQSAPGQGRVGNPTEAQNKDSFNANRMNDAGSILNRLEQGGFDFGRAQLGGQLTEDYRRYNAAVDEWADSLLRLTTGAAATRDEVESARRAYFPVVGDSPAVRQQKAERRAQVQRDALARGQGGRSDRNASTQGGQREQRQQPAPEGQQYVAGIRFPVTNAQAQQRQQIVQSGGSASARLGGRNNPYYVNPSSAGSSYSNIPSGAYFITPDGQIRGPKP